MKNFISILTAKILYFAIRIFKKNTGNVVGKIAKKLSPNIIKYFKISCPVVLVTATNGKTTTNNCIKYIANKNGKKVVSNVEGNNLETGIITTLIKNSTISGKVKADFVTLEVDESYVPVLLKKNFKIDTLVVINFFRDQLDRNGEVESLIIKIEEELKNYKGNLVLNSDDPNVVKLGKVNKKNKNVFYFSVDRYQYATDKEIEAGEGKFCPNDNERLQYEYYQYSHIGKFRCPKCGYGDEEIYTKLTNIDLKGGSFVEAGRIYKTLANNIYSMYNFAAALTVAKLYNYDAGSALQEFKLNNGRNESLVVNECETLINLAKNPTGANVSLRILNEDKDEKELLFVLNDKIADGFDVSWIWDINFDVKNCKRIITSGRRAYDMAIRIKTSGYDLNKIEAYSNLDDAVKALYKTKTKKYVISNYTALQPTRKAIMNYK